MSALDGEGRDPPDSSDPPKKKDLVALLQEEVERCGDFEFGQALPPEEGKFQPISLEDYRRALENLPRPTEKQIQNLIGDFDDANFITITRAEPHRLFLTLLPTDITGIPFHLIRQTNYGYLYAFAINEEGYCQDPDPNGCYPQFIFPPEIIEAGTFSLEWTDDRESLPKDFEKRVSEAISRVVKLIWPE